MRLALAVLLVAAVAVAPASAVDKAKVLEVRERINKAWDVRIEKIRIKQIESKCKAEAKKKYFAIRFKKRRAFVRDCIEQARNKTSLRRGQFQGVAWSQVSPVQPSSS